MSPRLKAEVRATPLQKARQNIELKMRLEADLAAVKEELEAAVIENNGEPVYVPEVEVLDKETGAITIEPRVIGLKSMPGRETLQKDKLVSGGVSMQQIKDATKFGDSYTQLDVRKPSKEFLKERGEAA